MSHILSLSGKNKTVSIYFQGARRSETFKATLVANQIRDEDHAGNSDVVITGTYRHVTIV